MTGNKSDFCFNLKFYSILALNCFIEAAFYKDKFQCHVVRSLKVNHVFNILSRH